ncbi:MAG: hypothetical protein J6D00_08395 [Christensenellaceae bacterium]|nr:hypothetical protein [Christensenellaceae bacterium]
MKKVLQLIWDTIRHNFWQKLVVFLFAFIIWSYILVDSNPVRRCEVNNITLAVMGTSELEAKHLIVTDGLLEEYSIDVDIEAEQNDHRFINSNNVTAHIDLSSINSDGEAVLSVHVETKYGIVKSVTPSEITVTAENIVERQVPVTYEYTGDPEIGYHVFEPEFMNNTVTLKGAESVVRRVTEAKCMISIVGLKDTITKSWSTNLLNYSGNKVEYGGLIIGGAPSVSATVRVLPMREVPIAASIENTIIENIPEGYEVTSISVDEKSMQIAGDAELIESIEKLALEPISVKGLTGLQALNATVEELDGVSYLAPRTVTVVLEIKEIELTKVFRSVPIEVRGNDDAVINQRLVDVTVTGPGSIVSQLEAKKLVIYADAENLSPGTYFVPLEIEKIDGIDMSKVRLSFSNADVTIPTPDEEI